MKCLSTDIKPSDKERESNGYQFLMGNNLCSGLLYNPCVLDVNAGIMKT